MMKYLIIIIFTLTAFGALGFGLYKALTKDLGSTPPQHDTGSDSVNVFPVQGTDQAQDGNLLLAGRNGDKIRVRDVRSKAVEVQKDPDTDKNIYILVDQVRGGEGYGLAFDEGFELFVIRVKEEGSRIIQMAAEQDLLSRLNIGVVEFCQLQFYITVTAPEGTLSESTTPSLCDS